MTSKTVVYEKLRGAQRFLTMKSWVPSSKAEVGRLWHPGASRARPWVFALSFPKSLASVIIVAFTFRASYPILNECTNIAQRHFINYLKSYPTIGRRHSPMLLLFHSCICLIAHTLQRFSEHVVLKNTGRHVAH